MGRMFQCGFYDRDFKQAKQLTIHIRSHTKERPFKCELCNISYSEKRTLDRHMKRHVDLKNHKELPDGSIVHVKHKSTNGRPYICDFCGKAYKNNAGLWYHSQPGRCSANPKGLPRTWGMVNNEWICEICDKVYTSKTGLDYHSTHSACTLKLNALDKADNERLGGVPVTINRRPNTQFGVGGLIKIAPKITEITEIDVKEDPAENEVTESKPKKSWREIKREKMMREFQVKPELLQKIKENDE